MSRFKNGVEWDRKHRSRVQMAYALLVGGMLITAGIAVVILEVGAEATTDPWVLGFGVLLTLIGGVAALPDQFMPILSAVIRKIPGKSGSEEKPTSSGE